MKLLKLLFIVSVVLGTLLFLLYLTYPKRIHGDKEDTPDTVSTQLTWRAYHELLSENYYYYYKVGRVLILTNTWSNTSKGLIDPTILPHDAWSAYHESRRENYRYPKELREELLKIGSLNDFNLIDPTTIPRDEWERFTNIAIQYCNKPNVSEEATVIDFTDNFVYVLFLAPKTERWFDFHYWVKMDRNTGEVLSCLRPPN